MPYNPIRLRNYDYARAWAYFVTICTQHRKCLFGEITNGVMRLNDAGNIDAREWMETARIRPAIELDEWTIIPNHFHGIVVILDGKYTAPHGKGTTRRRK
ncbi:hypothetical protein VU11_07940 [Desulfobulbus sp. US2]|nr:hypothetical protein [Desulfobulbus sp. US4]MCW5208550.1 hypothetical protein [Desulfobulbus sp. US2]